MNKFFTISQLVYIMSDQTICTTTQNQQNASRFNIPGTRYTPINPYRLGYTQAQLDMRRKAEILQYNKTSNGKSTKKQSFVTAVRGATQRRNFSSYYLRSLIDNPSEQCPSDILIPTLTTASDVPGPPIYLNYDPTIPLYNYNSQQNAYGTQNQTDQYKWLTNYETDIIDDNKLQAFTLNIQNAIDNPFYNYSFTTSVSLSVSGYNTYHDRLDVSGIFTMSIPPQNINLGIFYGGQLVTLSQQPSLTFSSGFLTDVSGYILVSNRENQYSGDIFMGNITFSNILLNTNPKNTYDFVIEYIPKLTINSYIDNLSVFIKINRTTTTTIESGLKFSKPGSSDPLITFNLTGQ